LDKSRLSINLVDKSIKILDILIIN
jgi:hypothetical protein